jgi:DNA-binding NarL/FixJ family response regulator
MPSIVLLQRDHEASPRLRALIDGSGRLEVVGLTHTVAEAESLLRVHRPDILVTDLRVQDGDVAHLLQTLRRPDRRARPHVLVTLVSHDDAVLLDALRAGADGYWVHARSPDTLIATLEQLARGESPMSPLIARQLLDHFDQYRPHTADTLSDALNPLVLTGTEREILQWVARGYLIDEIAQQWHASVHTLACGIRRVYHKLQFDLHANSLSLA